MQANTLRTKDDHLADVAGAFVRNFIHSEDAWNPIFHPSIHPSSERDN
jgi:hypothetical protein